MNSYVQLEPNQKFLYVPIATDKVLASRVYFSLSKNPSKNVHDCTMYNVHKLNLINCLS